jgi:hypothetical protein
LTKYASSPAGIPKSKWNERRNRVKDNVKGSEEGKSGEKGERR